MNKKSKFTTLLLTALLFIPAGCEKLFDDRNSATLMVPPERLQQIEKLDLDLWAKKPIPGEPNEVITDQTEAEEEALTIERCRALALENNLYLKVQLFNPKIVREGLNQAEADFEPLVFSNFNFIKTDTPVSRTLDASQQEIITGNAGINIPLRTGGEISLYLPYSRVEDNNIFSTLNPSYSADFTVSVDQPLLRGGGIQTNTHGIRIARYDWQRSKATTKMEVIWLLAAVDRLYWRLYAARRELEVQTLEYELAYEQLESARRKVNAGQVAEIEIIRAEEAVALSIEDIINADNALRDRERELKQVLNKPGLEVETATVLVPATPPNPQRYLLETRQMIEYALENRMELLNIDLQIASSDSSIDYARNGMLPVLNLNYTYNINGLGPSADDAFDLMLNNRFIDQQLGLVLQIPLGNETAQSRFRSSVLRRQQLMTDKEKLKLDLKREVLTAADQLEANWQRVNASRKSTLLAHRTLKAEQRQFDLGLETSTELLNAQTRFINAQSAEIRSLVEYQIAQVDLAYATGCLLGAAQIYWEVENESFSSE
ncbi:MAG: TolC family protein [Sedimentisphaerales bacterium]|nr:TolC family protein [Sedimentisphaerales bacterium]